MSTVGLRRRIDRLEDARQSARPAPVALEGDAARAELVRWMDRVNALDAEDMRALRFPPAAVTAYKLAEQFDGYEGPVQPADAAWDSLREEGYLEAARRLWERLGTDWPPEWPEPPATSE